MSSDLPMLEPLSLSKSPVRTAGVQSEKTEDTSGSAITVKCLFCENCYNESSEKDQLLRHLLLSHKLVIADVKLIADFKR